MTETLPRRAIHRWLLLGEWRAHPLRAVVAIGAIALGVALGFAVHLINYAALNEFSSAVKSLTGISDLQVRAAQPTFDEALYPRLAQHDKVAAASPVLELDAAVPGQEQPLKILGIDVFRASEMAPDLIGIPADHRPSDTLADDAIFLSPAAAQWLQVQQGDRLRLQSGTQTIELRVAGGVTRARPGQRIAVMDIGAAQWHFSRLGELSRIELKLAEGVDRAAFQAALAQELGDPYLVMHTEHQEQRAANMSRAYRVNLNILALVALFTGAFLVFSTQALSVIRRRQQFALLRVIGLSRPRLLAQILAEGGLLGAAGSVAGLALGYAFAAAALQLFGGDLGGGYFPGVKPSLRFDPLAGSVFLIIGTAIALLGSASPAWEATRAKPAAALKSGSEDTALSRLSAPWPALACLAAGSVLSQLPPVMELPLFGYLAIALLLIGGIALMPRLAALAFSMAGRVSSGIIPTLAITRLANAPNQASIALGGVLSSFSLMVAMAIMVASFRESVDEWLNQVLAADLYVQSAQSGNTGALTPAQQQAIGQARGAVRVDFLRYFPLTLDPGRPAVTLIARQIDVAAPEKTLPITGDALTPERLPNDALPVWMSEAMVDLYAYEVGKRVTLPVGGKQHTFIVAGIWRDYARQFGAIQMRLPDYRILSGDHTANDAALYIEPGTTPEEMVARLKELPFGDALQFSVPEEIRDLSLQIFDRSFAVTYLLEAAAIIIGLFGIAATFSAQTLAREKEFGMLRHIGVTRTQILAILAMESMALTGIGILVGFLLGWCISLILVFVVNPQSFHWTMQMHLPWNLLFLVAGALLVSAGITALAAGRHAISGSAIHAVRNDW